MKIKCFKLVHWSVLVLALLKLTFKEWALLLLLVDLRGVPSDPGDRGPQHGGDGAHTRQ
jgi:hypothetical protein